MGVLTVFLEKMTDLKDMDGMMNHPDPYVTLHLEKDNWGMDKNYGKQTSSKKKGTCNPTYNETFTFNDIASLENLELTVTIYDNDVGFDDSMGKVNIKLESELTPGQEKEFVEKLERSHTGLFSKHARVYLKIKYTQ